MKSLLSVFSLASIITVVAILHPSKTAAQFSIPNLPDIIEEQIEDIEDSVPGVESPEETLPGTENTTSERDRVANHHHQTKREIIDSPAWVYETLEDNETACLLDYNAGGTVVLSESGSFDSSDGTVDVPGGITAEVPYDEYVFQPEIAVPSNPDKPGEDMGYNVVITVVSDNLARIGGVLLSREPNSEWKRISRDATSYHSNGEGRIAMRIEFQQNTLRADSEHMYRVYSRDSDFVTGDYSISVVDIGEYISECR